MTPDTCARCGHAHRDRTTCYERTGGVPGFPSTQHPCGCREFVEKPEEAA